MEFVRNTLQRFAYNKEEEPCEQEAQTDLNHTSEIAQRAAPRQFRSRHSGKTGGAEHPVIVFGDAFAAQVASHARAARGSFPIDMIETALVSQIRHVLEIKRPCRGTFGS